MRAVSFLNLEFLCIPEYNDDRIGAMNLHRMGINYLEDSQVPGAVTTE
jgi:hypothetical protein